MRVKICGITNKNDLAAAASAGADALGFVVGFESSPRNISLGTARELISSVPPFVQSVLVTNKEFVIGHRKEVTELGPNAVQIYGNAVSAGDLEPFRAMAIRPYFVGGTRDPRTEVEGFDALLMASHDIGMPGGTGSLPDLRLSREVRGMISPTPSILSGGLNPGNVRDAILMVKPYAVDVSSGVEESPGIKDHAKMALFVKNAKEAEPNG